jgi:hypothetical protein
MLKRAMVFLGSALFVLLTGITLISCHQSPIFFIISLEVEPVDPRISGMPTNIVQVGDTLYVASRFSETVHQYKYDKDKSTWSTLPQQPGGKILDLAATNTNLYALTGDPGSARVYKKATGDSWEVVPNDSGYPNIQSIYGVTDRLFAGAMINDREFAILYEDNGTLKLLKSETKILQGVALAGTTYYLATAGDGIYTFDGTSPSPEQDPIPIGNSGKAEDYKVNVAGIITVGDQIVGVTKSGNLLYGNAEGFKSEGKGVSFTGGLALWKKADPEVSNSEVNLLLLGIQGGSTSTIHGYREIVLKPDGTLDPDAMGLNIPGVDPDHSSINNNDKYNSTLRRNPVIALFQAKDNTLFAATVKNGLWSYRERKGEYVWNAED